MTIHPLLIRKFKILIFICIFSTIVGLIFQKIHDGYFGFAGLLVGLFLGLGFGILELFLLKRLNQRMKKMAFHHLAIIKVLLYTTIVFLISNLLGLISGYFEGKTLDEFYASVFEETRLIQIIVALIMYTVIVLFLQISRLLGDGVLIKILTGKYNKPVEEERIFMFLDMKSSTTIAEMLGHEKFYELLNSCFHEITEPVLNTKAEIYQYVGDEIVFTWKMAEGVENANCLSIYFQINDRIRKRSKEYEKKYGVTPQFKAGVHYGNVIVGQIGDLKREIVFNGDVLNTTSRIQQLCNKYHKELLVSRRLLAQLKLPASYRQEHLGSFKLKGKENEINVFSITKKES
jgi:adenylate cyclase